MKNPIPQFLIGLGLGLLVPLLFGWLYLSVLYTGSLSMGELMQLLSQTSLLIKLLFMAILPNMFAVFLLNHFERWMMCRGVFVSVMIYIVAGIWLL